MDAELEAAIDEAGRQRVFALAAANGWNLWDPPPKWVWWELVREVKSAPPHSEEE